MRRARFALVLVVAALGAACSTLGGAPGQPEGLPHGGTGPFRLLTADEVDVPPSPTGATLFDRDRGVGSGMVADRHLFYGGAPLLPVEEPDGGPADAGLDGAVDDGGLSDAGIGDAGVGDAGPIDAGPSGPLEIDWSLFEPRRIYRSAPRAEGIGFDAGEQVLAASEAWEGGFVHDPWAVVLEDGRTRLYYAAEGGIGVAEAATIGGAFTRLGSRPILAGDVRRPSVIDARGTESEHAFLMYFERDGGIAVAGSSDGIEFTELGAIALTALAARDERDSVEVSVGGPGALAARTEAGRSIVRLYYESRRESGQILIAMAGSFDGVEFEEHPIPVVDDDALRWPAPRQLDPRVTLLYLQAARGGRPPERGTLVVGIAPGGVILP
ncbi:MAG: hypothetical protein M3Y87_08895 [Myxococcota bacterium]|nr:hypothetical protein [Myxococcota bacterium]